MRNQIFDIVDRIIRGGSLTEAEGHHILHARGSDVGWVLAGAQQLRETFCGDRVGLCMIVNAKSGHCSEDCRFCAQSAHYQTGAPVFPLKTKQQLVSEAQQADQRGARCFGIVTSGARIQSGEELECLLDTFREIRATTGIQPSASLGLLDAATADALADAGCVTYHHNLETARSYFPEICTTHDYEEDLETVRVAKAAGMKVCCGGLFGLGESVEQRLEFGLTLRGLDIDSVPINFLNPVAGTPLANSLPLEPMEALKIIALYRYLMPQRHITVCGGRASTLGDFQSWIFHAGASGMMVGDYLTTPGRQLSDDLGMVAAAGLTYECC
jgi:biotin synthase